MTGNAWLKDVIREIRGSFKRFLSIAAIIALGCGFFVGLKSASPDMKDTADCYFNNTRLMDIHLLSTMGFSTNDLAAIKKDNDFDNVMSSYSLDAMLNEGGSNYVVKIYALPKATADGKGKKLNVPVLVAGHMPRKSGECVVETNNIRRVYKFKVGDTINLSPYVNGRKITESIKNTKYEIVGMIKSPQYVSVERGVSTVGDGSVSCYMMVPSDQFKLPVYTDVYLTAHKLRNFSTFSDDYSSEVNRLVSKLQKLAAQRAGERKDEIKNDAQAQIDAQQNKLLSAQQNSNNALADAQRQIDSAKAQLKQSEQQSESKLNTAAKKISDGAKSISASQLALAQKEQDADSAFSDKAQQLADGEHAYDAAKQQYDRQYAAFESQNPDQKIQQLQTEIDALSNGSDSAQLKQLQAELAQLLHAKAQFEQTNAQLQQTQAQLSENAQALSNSKSSAQTQFAAASSEIAAAKKTLALSQKQYEQGKAAANASVAQAESKIADSERAFDTAKQQAEQKITNGQEKISDAEIKLSSIPKPKWYIQKRSDNPGYSSYNDNANRIDAISNVFPVFFLLVAALVCLTTMKRMVEEGRTQIGTFKALGYSRASIAAKFFIYAFLASVFGSAFGISIGYWLFPGVIYNAYNIMYSLMALRISFRWGYVFFSVTVAILCTVVVALFVCYRELLSQPAVLMRPKAPKAGKRIWLEHVKFIWNRMGFIAKVTARNLFLYKSRFLMTVLGIAGCEALILAGFGLNDSIFLITSRQFYHIYKYDMATVLKQEKSADNLSSVYAQFSADPRIKSSAVVREKETSAVNGGTKVDVVLVVPQVPAKLGDYITLQHRIGHQKVKIPAYGAVISEKMADLLHISAGGSVTVQDGGTKVKIPVSDITENYAYNYVYLSPAQYTRSFHIKPMYNAVLSKLKNPNVAGEKVMATQWLKKDNIMSVKFNTNASKDFNLTIQDLKTVILVLIISAGLLAFVVLYNLTNINICERIREIATIKVLGFYNKEVAGYVYRENIVITLVGMVLGVWFGIYLHQFLVVKTEVDLVMFVRDIQPGAYAFSMGLTLVFSLLVNFFMYFKLKNVSMTESLKSVE